MTDWRTDGRTDGHQSIQSHIYRFLLESDGVRYGAKKLFAILGAEENGFDVIWVATKIQDVTRELRASLSQSLVLDLKMRIGERGKHESRQRSKTSLVNCVQAWVKRSYSIWKWGVRQRSYMSLVNCVQAWASRSYSIWEWGKGGCKTKIQYITHELCASLSQTMSTQSVCRKEGYGWSKENIIVIRVTIKIQNVTRELRASLS